MLQLPLSVLRASDLVVLLAIGAIYEFATRFIIHQIRLRSPREQNMRAELHDLRYETAKKRSLGPSAFVETAKLERQVLAKEKELASMETGRSDKIAKMEAIIKKASTAIQVIIFLVYWGVPILSIDVDLDMAIWLHAIDLNLGVEKVRPLVRIELSRVQDPDGFTIQGLPPFAIIALGFPDEMQKRFSHTTKVGLRSSDWMETKLKR